MIVERFHQFCHLFVIGTNRTFERNGKKLISNLNITDMK